jgi:hypothetical protein
VLTVLLVGNGVALAAGGAETKTAMDPAKLNEALTARGIGKSVKVTQLDGTTVVGTLIVIQSDNFQITPNHATQPVTIQDADVKSIHNSGLSTGAKVGIGVGIGVGVVVLAAVISLATHPLP